MYDFSYELSRHRSRPPCPGIHRRTRCIVVDNSALGKEANTSGKLAYCIHVYKQGKRKKHMPHATLGDKVLSFLLSVQVFQLPTSRADWFADSIIENATSLVN